MKNNKRTNLWQNVKDSENPHLGPQLLGHGHFPDPLSRSKLLAPALDALANEARHDGHHVEQDAQEKVHAFRNQHESQDRGILGGAARKANGRKLVGLNLTGDDGRYRQRRRRKPHRGVARAGHLSSPPRRPQDAGQPRGRGHRPPPGRRDAEEVGEDEDHHATPVPVPLDGRQRDPSLLLDAKLRKELRDEESDAVHAAAEGEEGGRAPRREPHQRPAPRRPAVVDDEGDEGDEGQGEGEDGEDYDPVGGELLVLFGEADVRGALPDATPYSLQVLVLFRIPDIGALFRNVFEKVEEPLVNLVLVRPLDAFFQLPPDLVDEKRVGLHRVH